MVDFVCVGLRVNGYFVCMGLCGKILRRWVGAVPVCPPVSPCKGAFVVHPPRTMRVFLVWKRRCANVRAGTQAPPLRLRLDVARGCCPYHFKYNFLCVTILTEDKKISKHTCISLRDCYIIAHRNNRYD